MAIPTLASLPGLLSKSCPRIGSARCAAPPKTCLKKSKNNNRSHSPQRYRGYGESTPRPILHKNFISSAPSVSNESSLLLIFRYALCSMRFAFLHGDEWGVRIAIVMLDTQSSNGLVTCEFLSIARCGGSVYAWDRSPRSWPHRSYPPHEPSCR